jgi:hypothetical protein
MGTPCELIYMSYLKLTTAQTLYLDNWATNGMTTAIRRLSTSGTSIRGGRSGSRPCNRRWSRRAMRCGKRRRRPRCWLSHDPRPRRHLPPPLPPPPPPPSSIRKRSSDAFARTGGLPRCPPSSFPLKCFRLLRLHSVRNL